MDQLVAASLKPESWECKTYYRGDEPSMRSPDGILEHDASWLLAQCDREDKAVTVLYEQGGAHVPLFVHDGVVTLNLGEVAFGRVSVRRHVLVGNFGDSQERDWLGALTKLADCVGANAAIFLLGVVNNESLERVLSNRVVRSRFVILQQGPSYKRRLCDISAGFEAYLASLVAKSRQSMKRSVRRFEVNFDGNNAFEVFSELADIQQFLKIVEPISRKTYQGRMLGLALTADGHIGTKIIEGAIRGNVRCFLLSVRGAPVAWRVGFLSGSTFYSHHVGFDPSYEEWHPGVVMHMYSVRHLAASNPCVQTMDLLYGDNDFKRRASNLSRDETNYYLFPRRPRGILTASLLSLSNLISSGAGLLLNKFGLKEKVRSIIRRA